MNQFIGRIGRRLWVVGRGGGYTLPELLVTAAIIVLMTGLLLPVWHSGEKTLALERAVHEAGQSVRKAQELALRAQAYSCGIGSIYGYGVFFNEASPASYIIFVECESGNIGYDAGTDGVVETIQLSEGVQISSVSPSPSASAVFVPPVPTTLLKPGDPASLVVSLQLTGGGASKTVEINQKGVIDID